MTKAINFFFLFYTLGAILLFNFGVYFFAQFFLALAIGCLITKATLWLCNIVDYAAKNNLDPWQTILAHLTERSSK